MGARGMMKRQGRWGFILVGLILSVVFPTFARGEFIPNDSPGDPLPPPPGGFQLGFDPNDYRFLIYTGQGGESFIEDAMRAIGIPDNRVTVRYPGTPVTLNDLATHDILIVGWHGSMSGLNAGILGSGIKGRILLTGHDADYHTVQGPIAAKTFFAQAIGYVLSSLGTGLIVCADATSPPMTWLPEIWGITTTNNSGQTITSFTSQGLASGVYQGLVPSNMCNWGTSYHNTFTGMGPAFVPFEKGGTGQEVITIARTQPTGPAVHKVDDKTECVEPGDTITYTITVDPDGRDHAWVTVVDSLPGGVNYENILDPQYDAEHHSYTWELGALDAEDDPVVLTLTVTVNDWADPLGQLRNEVRAESDVGTGYAVENTPVCCWGGSVIYVDGSRAAGGNGTSWATAYNNLQDALARADRGCGTEIWVARGTYRPGDAPGDTFLIPPGVSVYGGFAGNETTREDRNWKIHTTILSGLIDSTTRNTTIVMMGNNTLLDGVIVREGANPGRGILGQNVNFVIENCVVEDNLQYGIRSENSNTTIRWCIIRKNGFDGIHHRLNGTTASIENCQIYQNQQHGIQVYQATSTILNNIIYRNGSAGTTYYGIYLNQPSAAATIRNNTLVDNRNEGIRLDGPNIPSVRNCILYANHAEGSYVDYSGLWGLQYCCLTDANDLQRVATPTGSNGNMLGNPLFAYTDILKGNFHLFNSSPCKNAGSNTGIGVEEVDMDRDERILDGTVDIGADEVACEDVSHPLDWNADGVVNYGEFEKFSLSWMTYDPNNPLCDPNNPNFVSDPNAPGFISQTDKERFDPDCDLDQDLDVDLADLVIFADTQNGNWLWVACWRWDLQPEQFEMMMGMAPDGGVLMQSLSVPTSVETTPVVPEKPIREQIIELMDTIQFLERLWLEDGSIQQEIDAEEWEQFMKEVYQSAVDLQKMETEPYEKKEVKQ